MAREQRNSEGTARVPGFDAGLYQARGRSRAMQLEEIDARP